MRRCRDTSVEWSKASAARASPQWRGLKPLWLTSLALPNIACKRVAWDLHYGTRPVYRSSMRGSVECQSAKTRARPPQPLSMPPLNTAYKVVVKRAARCCQESFVKAPIPTSVGRNPSNTVSQRLTALAPGPDPQERRSVHASAGHRSQTRRRGLCATLPTQGGRLASDSAPSANPQFRKGADSNPVAILNVVAKHGVQDWRSGPGTALLRQLGRMVHGSVSKGRSKRARDRTLSLPPYCLPMLPRVNTFGRTSRDVSKTV